MVQHMNIDHCDSHIVVIKKSLDGFIIYQSERSSKYIRKATVSRTFLSFCSSISSCLAFWLKVHSFVLILVKGEGTFDQLIVASGVF